MVKTVSKSGLKLAYKIISNKMMCEFYYYKALKGF